MPLILNGRVNGGAIRIDNLKYKYTDLNNTSRLTKVEDRSRPEGFEVTSVVKNNAGPNDFINFTYLGDMTKVKKVTKQGGTTTYKDYIGNVEYKNGQIEAIYHGDGRFTLDASGNQQYEYTLKDHLGNTRVTFTDVNDDGSINQSDILQENHYYPFGMQMGNNGVTTTGTQNDYQYNGKELNEDLGLDWYNYGFRMYDPAIARFTGVDPISDQFAFVSTYNYAENSPIKFIDLHGLQAAPPSDDRLKDTRTVNISIQREIQKVKKTGYFTTTTTNTGEFEEIGNVQVKVNMYTSVGVDGEIGTSDDITKVDPTENPIVDVNIDANSGIDITNDDIRVNTTGTYTDGGSAFDISIQLNLSGPIPSDGKGTESGIGIGIETPILSGEGSTVNTSSSSAEGNPSRRTSQYSYQFSSNSGNGKLQSDKVQNFRVRTPNRNTPTRRFRTSVSDTKFIFCCHD